MVVHLTSPDRGFRSWQDGYKRPAKSAITVRTQVGIIS